MQKQTYQNSSGTPQYLMKCNDKKVNCKVRCPEVIGGLNENGYIENWSYFDPDVSDFVADLLNFTCLCGK